VQNLYKRPGKRKAGDQGRPRIKGAALPKPEAVVRRSKAKRLKVRWYGGGHRKVEVIHGTGQWFKSGYGLVPVQWVFVRDLEGTHRDEYFFTTDMSMSAKAVIELYGARWNIETTFQEMRSHLGLETTRGWSRQTVLRTAPCLFVLYTLVVVLYDHLPAKRQRSGFNHWPGKEHVAFSDMIASVRAYLWMEWVFAQVPGGEHVQKLPPQTRKLITYGLAQAA